MDKFFESKLAKAIVFLGGPVAIYSFLGLSRSLIVIVAVIGLWIVLKFKHKIKKHPIYTCSIIALLTIIVHSVFFYFSFNRQGNSTVPGRAPAQHEAKACPTRDINKLSGKINQLAKSVPDNTDYEELADFLDKNNSLESLRKKCFDYEKPFQREFIEVDISFPDDEPSKGAFVTCDNSPFQDKKIQISTLDLSERIDRKYGGHIGETCTTEPYKIQLSKEDGEKLFGTPLFRDGKAKREGLAVLLNP